MNPGGRYYIKADGTDLNPCLQESKSNHRWFGDADLGDGKVQQVCYMYNSCLNFKSFENFGGS